MFNQNNRSRFKSHGRFTQGRPGGRRYQPTQNIGSSQYVNKAEPMEDAIPVEIKHRFEDFAIDEQLKQGIISRGYTIPTPIQDQAIAPILEGRDVIGIANTGTGKTAAFLVPIINTLLNDQYSNALIVIPTRELAVQIRDEFNLLTRGMRLNAVLCIGGTSMTMQMDNLKRGADVVIGTPGRLKDLIERRKLPLESFKTVVLDEVDRMVDIGFIQDIRFIVSYLPKQRQSLFFSATVSPQVNSIIQSFVKDPVTVSVKVNSTAKTIDQDIIRVSGRDEKIAKLSELLKQEEFKKVIIFGRTKWGVEKLSKLLNSSGFLTGSIHGNKSQNQRLQVLRLFKRNQLNVLVATDVAARGLDIEDVSHVINFDEPASYDDYVHRIGRTGRANKQGKALTFIG